MFDGHVGVDSLGIGIHRCDGGFASRIPVQLSLAQSPIQQRASGEDRTWEVCGCRRSNSNSLRTAMPITNRDSSRGPKRSMDSSRPVSDHDAALHGLESCDCKAIDQAQLVTISGGPLAAIDQCNLSWQPRQCLMTLPDQIAG
jgi:hypothetical protein